MSKVSNVFGCVLMNFVSIICIVAVMLCFVTSYSRTCIAVVADVVKWTKIAC